LPNRKITSEIGRRNFTATSERLENQTSPHYNGSADTSEIENSTVDSSEDFSSEIEESTSTSTATMTSYTFNSTVTTSSSTVTTSTGTVKTTSYVGTFTSEQKSTIGNNMDDRNENESTSTAVPVFVDPENNTVEWAPTLRQFPILIPKSGDASKYFQSLSSALIVTIICFVYF